MLVFRVEDMTCGHCASSVARAVRDIDAKARVDVSVAEKLVKVSPSETRAGEIAAAIQGAGYSPVLLTQAPAAQPAAPRSGCCCGNGRGGSCA